MSSYEKGYCEEDAELYLNLPFEPSLKTRIAMLCRQRPSETQGASVILFHTSDPREKREDVTKQRTIVTGGLFTISESKGP